MTFRSLEGGCSRNCSEARVPAALVDKLETLNFLHRLHVVRASDLVAALHVTLEEAEEMIFIADLKDNQSIDFTEFKQVVVNWSG